MRSFLLACFAVLSLYGANLDHFAQEMGFERDFLPAYNKAKHLQKPLVLILSKHDCGWCRRFEKRTLKAKPIHTQLQKDFVVVVEDKKSDTDRYPFEKYTAPFTPKSFFIDPRDGTVLLESNGYVKQEDFSHILDRVLRRFQDKGL